MTKLPLRYLLTGVAALSLLPAPASAQSAPPAPGDATAAEAGGAAQPVPGPDLATPNTPLLQEGANGTTVYDARYFAPFAPATALDMASRVPGFSIDNGNDSVRGFAGAAGNVVINGARPTSKSDSIAAQLQRIPAGAVARLEVGPGSNFGSDYAAKAQVLNVIVAQGSGGISGNVEARLTRLYTGYLTPDAKGSLSWKKGGSTLTLSAGTGRYDQREIGFDRLSSWPSLTEIEYREKYNEIADYRPFGAVNWGLEQGDNRSMRFNLRFSPSTFRLHQDASIFQGGNLVRLDDLDQDQDKKNYELGGDITRPLAGGALKLVALATREDQDNFDRFRRGIDQGLSGGFEQRLALEKNERILRTSWSRPKLLGFSAEFGGEVAFNKLDSVVDLSSIEPGGALTPIDLPIDEAVVSEKRVQLYTNIGRALSTDLRLEGGLAFEASRLKVRGDATADRSLRFFKPSLSLDWHPKSGWHGQLSLRRTVAQLDFFDFISSAELSSDRVSGGNADLLPQQAWEARASIEKPILGDGLAKLAVGYDRIDDLQDRVLTDEGFDAPGNLGRGTRRFVETTLDVPLKSLGLDGARLKLNGTWQKSRVLDPVSDRVRGFSGYWPTWQLGSEFRHDLRKFAYGFSLNYRTDMTVYRTDETDSNGNVRQPYTTAFVEYRPDQKTSITLDGDNLWSTIGNRSRYFSNPNRSVAPTLFEYRERNKRRSFTVTVKRQFG